MSLLHEWAWDWGINPEAVRDLVQRMGGAARVGTGEAAGDGSEARQSNLVVLDAAERGIWLTRNNVGAFADADGRFVRFGLANESARQNKILKSGDRIGIRPVLITPDHVGQTIGQFVSREIKKENWTFRGTERETAQLNWATFINSKGGDAKFATGPGSFDD